MLIFIFGNLNVVLWLVIVRLYIVSKFMLFVMYVLFMWVMSGMV